MMNSQRDNACKSLAKVSYEDMIIAPAVRFDEFHGLHKHSPGSTARIAARLFLYLSDTYLKNKSIKT